MKLPTSTCSNGAEIASEFASLDVIRERALDGPRSDVLKVLFDAVFNFESVLLMGPFDFLED